MAILDLPRMAQVCTGAAKGPGEGVRDRSF